MKRECGAKRSSGPGYCRRQCAPGRSRCRFHGGMATGPKTVQGMANTLAAMKARRARWLEGVRTLKKAGLIDKFPCGKKKGSPQRVPKTGDKVIDKARCLIRNGYGTAPRLPMPQVVELLRLLPPTRDEQVAAIRAEHGARPGEIVAAPEVRPPEPVIRVLTPREPAETWQKDGRRQEAAAPQRARLAQLEADRPKFATRITLWSPFEEKMRRQLFRIAAKTLSLLFGRSAACLLPTNRALRCRCSVVKSAPIDVWVVC
jgi:hypothetical protein